MHKIFDTEGLGVDHKYDRRVDRQTDGQTDRITMSMPCFVQKVFAVKSRSRRKPNN